VTHSGAVLIVEDAETCASILEIIFSCIEGLRTITAPSAEQAWELIDREPDSIGAIVTDLHMPGMDGFESIERVRGDERSGGVPIIVITGCTDADASERARILRADAFFAKPYSPAEVREKLEQLLKDD
jgi:DNA-binding response OmpR family regulator